MEKYNLDRYIDRLQSEISIHRLIIKPDNRMICRERVWFGLVLWHINCRRLFNVKSCLYEIYDFQIR